jgi:hypothetical protein
MKKLLLIILLLGSLSAQEIRRPTTDTNLSGCEAGTNIVSGSGASARDNNNATDYLLFMTGESCTPDEAFGFCNGSITYHSGRKFNSFSAASGSYTLLKLKIKYTYSSTDGGIYSVGLSHSSSDYTEVGDVGTYTMSSPTLDLTTLYVDFCTGAPPQSCTFFNCTSPSAYLDIFELWTEGTLAAGRKGQVIVVTSFDEKKKPRYEWRKQRGDKEIVVGWTHHYSKAKRWADIVRSSA